jgi:transposase
LNAVRVETPTAAATATATDAASPRVAPARPGRQASIDRSGRISKAGDQLVRTLLYEAARCGRKKAKVSLVRKLAVVLHRLWRDGTAFVPA